MKWISVDDRLPIDPDTVSKFEDMDVLICTIDGFVGCSVFSCGPLPKPWKSFEHHGTNIVKFWRLKPDPPRDELNYPMDPDLAISCEPEIKSEENKCKN